MLNEPFELPVTYNNKELLYSAKLVQIGYIHRFEVMVNDTLVYFEPDEERSYRAIIEGNVLPSEISAPLLHAVAQSIEKIIE